MTVLGSEAWITSAVEGKSVSKALVLAGSLRRVHTGKKLVVITTFGVAKELREKLKDAFDLVILIEQNSSNGLNLEEYAKVEAFSLQLFNKCVYLSPNTMVLRNSDEIFEKYGKFAALGRRGEAGVDSSVFLFTPSLEHSRALKEIKRHAENGGGMRMNGDIDGGSSSHFDLWLQNNIPNLESLEEDYNTLVNSQKGSTSKTLGSNTFIANFGDVHHPLDGLPLGKPADGIQGMSRVEKMAVDLCLQIHAGDGQSNKTNLHTDLSFQFDVYKKEPVAIVGMSFRLPGGNNADEFWKLLINGKEAMTPLPSSRWRKGYSLVACENRNVEAGFLSAPMDEFDANFFGIAEKEAELLDPQTRFLHEVTWEAFEDALIDPHSIRGTKTGIFVGTWLQDYRDMVLRASDAEFSELYMGSSISAGAASLSHFLGAAGPAVGTESGCSSAIVAVDMACKSLRNRESNMVLACGVNLLLHPFDYNTMRFVLSPDGRCKTFDEGANGFARAEGCGVLIMKRLSDAVRDGDKIWGMIRGSGVTQEGTSKSLGTPTVHCESLAMEMALKDAAVDPLDVSYIETHGTGTPVGDPMEMAAIKKAYSQGRSEPLVVGSVKTNVGHTESASGITGIIKVLLSMKNELIPKHLNLERLNPAINLEGIPAKIPLEPVAWPKRLDKPRIAGVSSFGISGTDGHVIIQEPPTISPSQIHEEVERPLHIMKISAKCPESLQQLLKTYQNLLSSKEGADDGFADMAYSANTGRATLTHRAVIIAKDFKEAKESIKTKSFKFTEVQNPQDKLCFLFPGEAGSSQQQYPRMGEELYRTSPIFREAFQKCDHLLKKQYGIDLKGVLRGEARELGPGHLHPQISTFCIEYSLLKLWESWGVKPDAVLGHGVGEYVAAVAVGLLELEDGLKLAVERGRFLDSPRSRDGCQNDPSLTSFMKLAQKLQRREQGLINPPPKYISGMEGKPIELSKLDGNYWVRQLQLQSASRFKEACAVAQIEGGCSIFLAVGFQSQQPSLALGSGTPLLQSITAGENEWNTLLGSLAQLHLSGWKGQVEWNGFDQGYKRSRIPLPFYPFQRKKIWKRVETGFPMEHPLLGRPIPTASCSTIFENRVTLKNAPFTQDHVIGNTVVFPGAGFLEMCLAGGHAATEGRSRSETLQIPRQSVALKSLKISSPLALYDSGYCRLQTVAKAVEDEETNCYSVGVHRYFQSTSGGMGEWIPHATAKFLQTPAGIPDNFMDIDIQAIQTTWEKSDNTEFYEKLPEVGLRFGPKFQSLETGWKSETGMLVSVKIPEDNDGGYLIHPIVADAMIQATMLWTSKDKLKMKLQVPVHIGEFLWLQSSPSSSPTRYIYCGTNKEGKTDCILLDGEGQQLAQMKDVDLIETTVKLVEGMLTQQKAAMPKIWGDVWKSTPGALYGAYDLSQTKDLPFLDMSEEKRSALAKGNDVGERERAFYNNLCNLTRLYFLNAMYEQGWRPRQGLPFSSDDLINLFPEGLKEHFKRYIRFFLRALAEAGTIIMADGLQNSYRFGGAPPTQREIDEGLAHVTSPEDAARVEHRLVVETGRNLRDVMLGKIEALSLLFPEDPSKANAGQFYATMQVKIGPLASTVNAEIVTPVISQGFKAYVEQNRTGVPSPVFRMLEVGAGTGASTRRFLEYFEGLGKPFEYCYTDVSASFFGQAEKEFEKYAKQMVFKKFDMNEDPLAQGFCPGYFDMIGGSEVLHVAKDMKKTLRNLRRIMKPGGIFEIIETTVPDLRITQIFGILDGYWQYEDLEFRQWHTTLTPEKWEEALRDVGCDVVDCTSAYNSVHSVVSGRLGVDKVDFQATPQYSWLVFYTESTATLVELLGRKLGEVNRKVRAVKRPAHCTEEGMKGMMKSEFHLAAEDVLRVEGVVYLWGLPDSENRDQSQISLPLINLVREMQECKVPPRLYVVTQGTAYVDGSEVISPAAATLHGIIKSLTNEIVGMHLSCLDLSPEDTRENQVEDIFYELWWPEKGNRIICFRERTRLFPKLTQAKVQYNEPLALPSGCDRFQLLLPKTRLISDLEFGVLESWSLGETEVEVQVKAMALNFRDVFTVLKPIKQFEDLNTVGLDLAGVVTKVGSQVKNRKVGDRVIGMNMNENLSLPSHIKQEESLVVPLPPSMTLAEGVTLPAVFLTAMHCLINVAKMKKGDRVLIHTASGGVGLCAIQLAKGVGAEVIATAGSRRKQNYLRNLGVQHVFHSRNTQFGKQILEVTHGKGVDIVLNSITGEGFKEASLGALAKNGRFIEMSKLNVWKPEEVEELRPDVFYRIVDLPSLSTQALEELTNQLKEFLHSDHIRPIAYERFDGLNIRGALNYLQKAKHIGKIVCVMPEVKVENSKITSSTPMFNDRSTYLVTGGLGGIGFAVVKWMLGSGAKHVAIASRSPPKQEILSQLEAWNRNGKHVEAFPVDIGDLEQCRALFQELASPSRGFPQIRGVMHAAGVLADAVLENQTWDNFKYTYNPKVNGSWNLHDLTKDMVLEHFVLFSSSAASLGSPGQTNHAASNSFEDSLAAYRKSIGLPATTINWGNWGEVGVATELDFPGIRPLSTCQGILALETFLKTQTSHLNVINLESFALAAKIFPYLKTYVDDKKLFGDLKATVIINSDEFWKDVDSVEDREGKLLLFKTSIKSTLRNILKMDQDEVIDDLSDFQTLGIDSLMMLELKNGLQNILGSRLALTANQLKDCSNTEILANRLVDILLGEEDLSETVLPTMEELQELIKEDSLLPEHIRLKSGMKVAKPSNEIGSVLLVGATGVLGPYLLRELSHRPSIKKVYCMLRKSHRASPQERLLKRLQATALQDQVDMSKVVCIQGDLTDEKFGLPDPDYDKLAEDVEAVINSAVRSDHTAKYWKSPDKAKLDIRTVNVKGTIRLLEFASHLTLKHVYHASTLLTVMTTDGEGCLCEDWQDVGVFDQMPFNAGYPISKHISEQLCKQAADRGIPCKTFRLPFIGGDSSTGRCDYLTNHVILRWLAYLKLKCMPDMPAPLLIIAVDHCAKLSLDVFFNPRAPHDVYNLSHKDAGMDQTLIAIAEKLLGIQIEPVSFTEFVAKLKLEREDSPLAPFKKMYADEEAMVVQNFESNPVISSLQKYTEDSTNFFRSLKLPQLTQYYGELEPTEDVMARDVLFLKESGVFEKFGIKN